MTRDDFDITDAVAAPRGRCNSGRPGGALFSEREAATLAAVLVVCAVLGALLLGLVVGGVIAS